MEVFITVEAPESCGGYLLPSASAGLSAASRGRFVPTGVIGQGGSRNGNLETTMYSLQVRIQVPGVARNHTGCLMSIVTQGRQALPTRNSTLSCWSSALLLRIIWALPGIT